MHVLNVLDYSAPYPGGIIDHLSCLGEECRRRGHRLTLAFPRERSWTRPLSAAALVVTLPSITRPITSGFRRDLRRICVADRVDLAHLHFSFALPFALALGRRPWPEPVVYHWCNPPRVLQAGDGASAPDRAGEGGPFRRLGLAAVRVAASRAARFADHRSITRHIAISGEIRDLLVAHRWCDPGRILLLPNGVRRPGAIESRNGRNPGDDGVVIGSVANFRPQKDHATLLRAFAEIAREYPRARLVLVGDGPTRPAAEGLCHDLGIESRVEFAGFVEDVGTAYRRFDLFVLASRYEGQGLVLLEAMSRGLPIVATAVGGIPETVRDGITGMLVPPSNVEALAGSLRRLAGDPGLRERFGRAGRDHVLRFLSVEDWAGAVVDLYEELCSASREAGR